MLKLFILNLSKFVIACFILAAGVFGFIWLNNTEDEVLDIVTEEFYQRMRPDLSMIGTSSETYKIRTKDNIKSK